MKAIDGMMGLVIGDAFGLPIKYTERKILLNKPITKMIGNGNYNLPKGSWSDNTSLCLATADSILKCQKLDYDDMMLRYYHWLNKGCYRVEDDIYDIDNVVKNSLYKYYYEKQPANKCGFNIISSNTCGSLIRMYPISYYCYKHNLSDKEIEKISYYSSRITHSNPISVLGCYLYIMYTFFILKGFDKKESFYKLRNIDYSIFKEETLKIYHNILKEDISLFNIDQIKSDNYIVHALEAIFWVILNTDNFKESIILSANLGEEADTISSLVGSITGLIYGLESIPNKWINNIQSLSYIKKMTSKFEASFNNYFI